MKAVLKYFLSSFTFSPISYECLKGYSGLEGLVVIPCTVFLYFGPVLNQTEFDAVGWLLSKARNHMFVNWLYQHHLRALRCIKLPIPEPL